MQEVSSAPPLVVASFVWQPRTAAFVLTVICKATYALTHGVSPLIMTPSAPLPGELYWDDNPIGSIHTPTDFVPFKRHVDVLLGGHAYTPPGQATGFFVARFAIGTVNKAIAVHGDRHWMPDGSLSEPVPFMKMPLRWERAAGGPTTWNPVGVPTSKQAQWPRSWPAPNLEPVGFRLQSPTQLSPPIGFGALAPHWPTRAEHLNQHRPGWVHGTWYERPLPPDVDAAYFNAAPSDQQIAKLPTQMQIVLVHLHPKIPRLVTVLEDVCPLAVVMRNGVAPQEIGLRCDTVFVDTDLGTCTLTWRASVSLTHPQEDMVVLVNPTRGGESNQAPLKQQPARNQIQLQYLASTHSPSTAPLAFSEFVAAPAPEARALEPASIPLDGDEPITLVGGLMNLQSPPLHGPALPVMTESLETARANQARAVDSAPSTSNNGRTGTLVPGLMPATSLRPHRPTLPFVDPDPKMVPTPEASANQPASIARHGKRSTTTLPLHDLPRTHALVLPFTAASPTTAPAIDAGGRRPAARASNDDRTGTLVDGFIRPTTTPLPFQTASSPEIRHHASLSPSQLTPTQSSSQDELEPEVQMRPLIEAGSQSPWATGTSSVQPFLATSPPGATPLAIGPSEDFREVAAERADRGPAKAPLSLEQYARIKMQLWGAHITLSEVLERHGIDEVEWRIHERRQADALADEGREGRCDLALALVAAFEASQGPNQLC